MLGAVIAASLVVLIASVALLYRHYRRGRRARILGKGALRDEDEGRTDGGSADGSSESHDDDDARADGASAEGSSASRDDDDTRADGAAAKPKGNGADSGSAEGEVAGSAGSAGSAEGEVAASRCAASRRAAHRSAHPAETTYQRWLRMGAVAKGGSRGSEGTGVALAALRKGPDGQVVRALQVEATDRMRADARRTEPEAPSQAAHAAVRAPFWRAGRTAQASPLLRQYEPSDADASGGRAARGVSAVTTGGAAAATGRGDAATGGSGDAATGAPPREAPADASIGTSAARAPAQVRPRRMAEGAWQVAQAGRRMSAVARSPAIRSALASRAVAGGHKDPEAAQSALEQLAAVRSAAPPPAYGRTMRKLHSIEDMGEREDNKLYSTQL